MYIIRLIPTTLLTYGLLHCRLFSLLEDMMLVSTKDGLPWKFASSLVSCLYILHVVLVEQCYGFTKQTNIRGVGFQKEHDGSIIGMDDGIQQISITGIIMYLHILKFNCK